MAGGKKSIWENDLVLFTVVLAACLVLWFFGRGVQEFAHLFGLTGG